MRTNPRMVGSFYRSFSLPCQKHSPKNTPRFSKSSNTDKSFHVRSTSLPCRSHPIVAQLEDNIRALREWQSGTESESPSLAWLCAGIAQLELLHDSMDDLLQLPQIQGTIRNGSGWIDKVLDDFLSFADAHSTFRSALIALREHHSEAQIAFRRRDDIRLASCIRSQKRIEKELFKLASEILEISKLPATPDPACSAGEAELAGILREVSSLTASSSSSIILGIAAASATTSAVASCSSSARPSWMINPLRRLSSSTGATMEKDQKEEAWRQNALEKLEALEECIGALDGRNERMLRSMLNTRVSLLNMLTPAF